MPESHRNYGSWDGKRFRKWAAAIGDNTLKVIEYILASKQVEEQTYLSCRSLLMMTKKYSEAQLESACAKALRLTSRPSYKSVKDILLSDVRNNAGAGNVFQEAPHKSNPYGVTRGAGYYGGDRP